MNLFEKDFIVVPINEHSHWFVAVICFPGKEGCRDIETDIKVELPESQVRASQRKEARRKKRKDPAAKRVMQIGSTSIIPLKGATGGSPAVSLLDKIGLDDDQVRSVN